jgi:exodeoxyribonuclease V alpha subunit
MTTSLIGVIQKIVFRNDDNNYTVLRLIPEGTAQPETAADGTVTAVGNLPAFPANTRLQLMGEWQDNERFGKQFRIAEFEVKETAVSLPTVNGEEVVVGTVASITFFNPDSGWCVLDVHTDGFYENATNGDGNITVVGVMPELVEGERAEFTGKWVMNPQYGRQFKALNVIPIAPENEEGIITYLAERVLYIGERTARRIVEHFGEKTLDILDADPSRIYQVPGIKTNQAESFLESWKTRRAERQILIHLQSYGITAGMAFKIFKHYGEQTLLIVQANPYQLADDIDGIGFKRADAIALGMKTALDAPQRLAAGLTFALNEMANEGHTFMPRLPLLEKAAELLNIEGVLKLEMALHRQIMEGRLIAEKLVYREVKTDVIYLPMYYHCEKGAAQRLRTMRQTPSLIVTKVKNTNWIEYLREIATRNQVELTEIQQSAVQAALTQKVSVLTGGPGTGKTTTLQMVIHALEDLEMTYALASPTGRAAKRLGEATERSAKTIHRLLEWTPEGFSYDEEHPLKEEFIIVDETSMLDLVLFYSLLKAIKPTAHLMLVGDVDQLPSVGAGNVLKDVINSGIAHVTRLTQIFRQAADSHIVNNAHRINQGELPYLENQSRDFFFFAATEALPAAELVVDIVQNRLAKKLGEYDRLNDVQVIAPMYRGAIGVDALNQALQKTLNPHQPHLAEHRIAGKLFRVGDKVMQTKNNYEKDVFNGDIGRVRGFDLHNLKLEVQMEERVIEYTFDEAEQLIHAYCISTHRSQGSEYPVVVMPLMTQHYIMLQRNLLYTAITRAKKMVVLVGDRKAVYIAVNNNKVAERYSGLVTRLQG